MTKKEKKELIKIILTVFLLITITILPVIDMIKLILYIFTYLLIGYNVILKALRNIVSGQVFDETS